MRESWLDTIDSVLCPARPRLEVCERERELHLARRRAFADERMRAISACERRIEDARSAVFASNDGVVSSLMTSLEREWRMLSRRDPDAGLMDLWVQVAPAAWIDRKRWRDSAPAAQLDAAIALASDPEGVEAAESAVDTLRAALAAWGTPIGSRIRWRAFDHESEHAPTLLAAPLAEARRLVSLDDAAPIIVSRAERLERDLLDAATARHPDRPFLVRDLAHAAFVDEMLRAASIISLPNPVIALRALWKTGYVVSSIDSGGTTLEIPS